MCPYSCFSERWRGWTQEPVPHLTPDMEAQGQSVMSPDTTVGISSALVCSEHQGPHDPPPKAFALFESPRIHYFGWGGPRRIKFKFPAGWQKMGVESDITDGCYRKIKSAPFLS